MNFISLLRCSHGVLESSHMLALETLHYPGHQIDQLPYQGLFVTCTDATASAQ